MALKTDPPVPSVQSIAKSPADPKAAEPTMLLELTMYKNYALGGLTYERGKAYRFKQKEAMKLLRELDTGRPVWRIYKPPAPKKIVRKEVDATQVEVVDVTTVEPIHGVADVSKSRIDVGSDEEIADIIRAAEEEGPPPDDDSGDVTV